MDATCFLNSKPRWSAANAIFIIVFIFSMKNFLEIKNRQQFKILNCYKLLHFCQTIFKTTSDNTLSDNAVTNNLNGVLFNFKYGRRGAKPCRNAIKDHVILSSKIH